MSIHSKQHLNRLDGSRKERSVLVARVARKQGQEHEGGAEKNDRVVEVDLDTRARQQHREGTEEQRQDTTGGTVAGGG